MKYEKIPIEMRRMPKYLLVGTYSFRVPELKDHQASLLGALLQDGKLTVEDGYRWDGPSGPTIDTENWMRASLVHDVLCDMIRYAGLDPKMAQTVHNIMWRFLREDGMSRIRAGYSWLAVSLFGKVRPYGGSVIR
jgi:hypothetical protein